jgi:hypothetical protein
VLRIELRTPTLPMWYSNQLSYTGVFCSEPISFIFKGDGMRKNRMVLLMSYTGVYAEVANEYGFIKLREN